MICNHNIGIRPALAVGVGVGVRVGVGLPPIPEGGSSAALDELFGLPESVPTLVIGSDTDIYSALKDIVPSMDLSISAQQAAGFTRQTQWLVGKDTSIGESMEQGNGSELEQFFGVVEPKDCQWMTDQEVCQALEQIMQTIDPELTASMAQSITTQTQQS